MPGPPQPSWQPTAAYLRAAVAGVGFALAGVLLGRPDLLLLGVPLLVVAVWSTLTRPDSEPRLEAALAHRTVREGEATSWRAQVRSCAGMEHAVALVLPSPWLSLRPGSGVSSAAVPTAAAATPAPDAPGPATGEAAEAVTLKVEVQTRRWGRRQVGPALVAGTSAWGAFRWGPHECHPLNLSALPLPAVFDAAAPTPHPRGLVGLNRSARPGDGSEFAAIRPFQAGDRLRRINWPVSTRTGQLHVTATWADQDSHVVLVVDAINDLGTSEGLGGRASSLDVTVRAAGALAEHHLRRGDRVALRVVGAANVTQLPPATGRNHLRRVLDTLAGIEVGTDRGVRTGKTTLGLSAGALVVMLSPLVSWHALEQAVTLASHGLTVVVVDTLPAEAAPVAVGADEGRFAALAWRIRLLERDREIRRVQRAGVAVVPWRGPGSLDLVLRDIARRGVAPRLVR